MYFKVTFKVHIIINLIPLYDMSGAVRAENRIRSVFSVRIAVVADFINYLFGVYARLIAFER